MGRLPKLVKGLPMNTRIDDILVAGFYLIALAIFLLPFVALAMREIMLASC